MGRFSCFYGHKKTSQPSFETMIKMLQVSSPNHASASSSVKEISVSGNDANSLSNDKERATLSSRGWRSGEHEWECNDDSNVETPVFEMGNLRRSMSACCDLDQNRRIFDDDKTDDCNDQAFSCEGSHYRSDIADLSTPNVAKSVDEFSPEQDQRTPQSLSPHCSSDMANNESIFSFSNANYLEKGQEDCRDPSCIQYGAGSGRQSPRASTISKSCSMPNLCSTSPTSQLSLPALGSRNRSFEDVNMLGINNDDIQASDARPIDITELSKGDNFCQSEKFDGENTVLDNYDSFEYGCSSKDWIVPVADDMGMIKHELGESSVNNWGHYPSQDFRIRRIEDWVVDLQHCSPAEGHNQDEIASSPNVIKKASSFLDGLDSLETKLNPGIEAAKRYISSLNATSTTMQLANHGLVAIPLLGAFASLKVLNLSGNSIVRITAGALPRGLHMLNLSKNKLSTIEGLRELSRLRILDLSYNKIARLGHGLASCSSVKELYLAGNKISEVEGLHRLLKLAVLDLRFNKIATSKSLGQLAANYNSLQAISLEGNPAQKNVGDDQLKKFLQGLLPHLAYYNRQHIKTSTLKDSSDKAVRLGPISDRGIRSDHKSSSRRSVSKRASHSSSQGQKYQTTDSPKQSKGRHGLAVPSGSRMGHRHNLETVKSGVSLHKSQSEGTLAVV